MRADSRQQPADERSEYECDQQAEEERRLGVGEEEVELDLLRVLDDEDQRQDRRDPGQPQPQLTPRVALLRRPTERVVGVSPARGLRGESTRRSGLAPAGCE
jgi:hypothetical protein